MGNSPGKQALDDFAKAIRSGNVEGARRFLQQVSAARGREAGSDKLTEELKTLDLNQPVLSGLTPLQLAASLGRSEIVRLILDAPSQDGQLPGVDANAPDARRRTALHLAAGIADAQCVADLLGRRADACIADTEGRTPLDVARAQRCARCVRTLEDRTKLWQGWADHDEHSLLQLPNWRRRWLVVCQDRYPNTGPPQFASGVTVSCWNCSTVLQAPAYSFWLQCGRCGADVSLTTSLQVAIYEPRVPTSNSAVPDTPMPVVILRLPASPSQIVAKPLEEASLKSFAGALMEGKLRRALQSTSSSTRAFGLTVKCLGLDGRAFAEHSFRVAAERDRVQLLGIFQDPAKAAFEASCAQAGPELAGAPAAACAAAAAASSSAGGQALPWSCTQCTYLHVEREAALAKCAMCEAPRGPPVPAAVADFRQACPELPEPSAPPLGLADGPDARPAAPAAAPIACATAAAPGPEPHGRAASEDEAGLCVVCLERPADTAVVPCGHLCACVPCLQSVQGTQDPRCPMCRSPMTSTIRIYRN